MKPLSYQWYLGANPISATTNLTATNAVLVLTNVQVGQSGGFYSVLVTNSAGQSNSASALLTVNALPPSCDPTPAGLVSWWTGQSNANDSFGANNGTLVGGVTFTNGEVGQAFSFDGVSGTVDVPDSPGLELTSQITIEAWIKPLTTNGDQSIIAKISASPKINGYQFALSGNKLGGIFNSPGLTWPSSSVLCPLPFVPGTWYHVAWTYDQSAMKLYFNGQPVATNVIGPQPIATSSADLCNTSAITARPSMAPLTRLASTTPLFLPPRFRPSTPPAVSASVPARLSSLPNPFSTPCSRAARPRLVWRRMACIRSAINGISAPTPSPLLPTQRLRTLCWCLPTCRLASRVDYTRCSSPIRPVRPTAPPRC